MISLAGMRWSSVPVEHAVWMVVAAVLEAQHVLWS